MAFRPFVVFVTKPAARSFARWKAVVEMAKPVLRAASVRWQPSSPRQRSTANLLGTEMARATMSTLSMSSIYDVHRNFREDPRWFPALEDDPGPFSFPATRGTRSSHLLDLWPGRRGLRADHRRQRPTRPRGSRAGSPSAREGTMSIGGIEAPCREASSNEDVAVNYYHEGWRPLFGGEHPTGLTQESDRGAISISVFAPGPWAPSLLFGSSLVRVIR